MALLRGKFGNLLDYLSNLCPISWCIFISNYMKMGINSYKYMFLDEK
jgi:hypothetical protein